MPVYLNDLGIICALGHDKSTVIDALVNNNAQEYLSKDEQLSLDKRPIFVGQVNVPLPSLEKFPTYFNSRNNQLAYLAFQQISESVEQLINEIPKTRVAVIMGTSTSGILEGELARKSNAHIGHMPPDFHYLTQEMSSPANFIASIIGAEGPCYGISTACSSSAKALVSAKALLESGLADVVICGGVDSLSALPINGFQALESMAKQYCQPFSQGRDGINIGEGAALFVMSKHAAPIQLLGSGESSDAYHVSAPDPQGQGAISAMTKALNSANLQKHDIDYINAHGTATPKNDEMEAHAIFKVFGFNVPCSSTKRFTGHTLGAAGALEAGICWLLLSEYNFDDKIPGNKAEALVDEQLEKINLSQGQVLDKLLYCLSNSFAFGGNNISLILGKVDD
ncbi:beta-ketoacyl-[acyl-carrier-protein] synthase family protein [Thalassotalea piscium]